jgi:phage head maturation protease
MRVLFHHGMDPRLGMQVLGRVASLQPSTDYEVPLYDTPEIRSLLPGLGDGQYGSSFKFSVVKEEVAERPGRSDWNPGGLPQVTITEAKVREFGPTPLPAYPGTSAGLRSITDQFVLGQLQADPERLVLLVEAIRAAALQETEPDPNGETTSPVSEPQHSAEPQTGEEVKPSWLLE